VVKRITLEQYTHTVFNYSSASGVTTLPPANISCECKFVQY